MGRSFSAGGASCLTGWQALPKSSSVSSQRCSGTGHWNGPAENATLAPSANSHALRDEIGAHSSMAQNQRFSRAMPGAWPHAQKDLPAGCDTVGPGRAIELDARRPPAISAILLTPGSEPIEAKGFTGPICSANPGAEPKPREAGITPSKTSSTAAKDPRVGSATHWTVVVSQRHVKVAQKAMRAEEIALRRIGGRLPRCAPIGIEIAKRRLASAGTGMPFQPQLRPQMRRRLTVGLHDHVRGTQVSAPDCHIRVVVRRWRFIRTATG